MDENDQAKKPAEDAQPSQPGDRLRRLIASSQEGDSSILASGTGSHRLKQPGEPPAGDEQSARTQAETEPEEPAPIPVEPAGETPQTAQAETQDESSGESETEQESRESETSASASEEPAGEAPRTAQAGTQDVPSGEPEASEESPESGTSPEKPGKDAEVTNSWFGEVYNRDIGDTQPVSSSPQRQHPTGSPEQTGGWYGQEMEETLPPLEDPNQTLPSTPVTSDETVPAVIPDPNQTRVIQPDRQSSSPPPYGKDPTVLPRRVEEVDMDATQVTQSALGTSQQYTRVNQPSGSTRPNPVQRTAPSRPARQSQVNVRTQPPPKAKKNGRHRTMGCFLRILIGLLFLVVVVIIGVGSFLVIKYFSIAASLPSVDDLRSKASQFETTRILDRNGNLIYEIIDPNAGKRTYVSLDKISPYLIAATLATEDKDFYTHPGFDPLAIARALWQNYTTGEVVSGASTITQQLARALLLSPEESSQRTVERKAREIVLASEITRKYSKEDILELYLNENYYGRLAYGVEAAAETYFHTTADKLSLGESAFLAGIPQSPAIYDIQTNRDATLNRFRTVVVLTYQLSQERNCIDVSTSTHSVCVDQQSAVDAVNEIENYDFEPSQDVYRFPHWVDYIRFYGLHYPGSFLARAGPADRG